MAQKGKGGDGDWRHHPNFRPRKICTFFLEGRCTKGSSCTFAHTQDELHPDAAEQALADAGQPELASASEYAQIEQMLDAVTAPESSAAEESLGQCLSSLQGPREFPKGAMPKQVCSLWLRHPVLCGEGDECLFAHGLMEMGLDVSVAVRMQTSSDETPVHVQVVNPVSSGKGSSKGYGQNSAKGAQPIVLGSENGGKSYGKAGKAYSKSHAAYEPYGKSHAAYEPYGKGGKDGKFAGKVGMAALAGPLAGKAADGGKGGKGLTGMSNRFGAGGFMPMKLCQFWVESPSSCSKGDACSFAHGVAELNPSMVPTCGITRFHHTGFHPTQMCTFHDTGRCTKGITCTYAHSPEELLL